MVDVNSTSDPTLAAVINSTGSYFVGSDMRGLLTFSYTANSVTTNNTFAIAIGNWQQVPSEKSTLKTLATELRLTRIGDGQYGAGQCFRDQQNAGRSKSSLLLSRATTGSSA